MATVKIISPKFVEGFTKECYEAGLMEKEATALLDGYLDATMQPGEEMQKEAAGTTALALELFKRLAKGTANTAWSAAKGGFNTAKYPLTWISKGIKGFKGGPIHGALLGLGGATAAYGAPLAALDYYKTNGDGDVARWMRNTMGSKSLFGFEPSLPDLNSLGIDLESIGGYRRGRGYGLNGGAAVQLDNPYTGPLATRLQHEYDSSPGSRGFSAGSKLRSLGGGSSTFVGPDRSRYEHVLSSISDYDSQEADLLSRMKDADPVQRRYLDSKRRELLKKRTDEVRKANDMESRSNMLLRKAQAKALRDASDAERVMANRGRSANEVIGAQDNWFTRNMSRSADKAMYDYEYARKSRDRAQDVAEVLGNLNPIAGTI